ncbi:Glyoxal reductase (GR) (Methylglyoxal reductase) [Durusdinium trenchii]|uniref:Glyoxal reductase (GR) (Methylglyoxal reductase) n=1 Tax=Durusdinium trenchii TaxID=1381693 RepID=A0ABP0IN77_9DINO
MAGDFFGWLSLALPTGVGGCWCVDRLESDRTDLMDQYVMPGCEPSPGDFAEAALKARGDHRLEAYIRGGKDPEETHFDELDWLIGFSELWLYALRNARLALSTAATTTATAPSASPLSSLRRAERQLLAAHGREERQRRAFQDARITFDQHAAELRAMAEVNATREVLASKHIPLPAEAQLNRSVRLSNGLDMPRLGLGTTMLNGEKGKEAILEAFRLGYRLVDTAQSYGNEAELGSAWRSSGLPRHQLFLVTKLSEDEGCRRKRAKALVRQQLKLMQTNYIDQYMLHGPCPGMYGAWKDLEELYDEGVVRSLGVSNFNLEELKRFNSHVRVKPHVVQNKFSIYHRGWAPVQTQDVAQKLLSWGVVLMGYCNLDAYPHVLQPLEDVHVKKIAQKHHRTVAQVLLRHALQHGTVVIPKSERAERLRENADIFSFQLSAEEMRLLDALPLLAYHFKKPKYIEDVFRWNSKEEL